MVADGNPRLSIRQRPDALRLQLHFVGCFIACHLPLDDIWPLSSQSGPGPPVYCAGECHPQNPLQIF